ncbi:SDR family NAD(P)-dependent oxidoreductase [Brevibacillus nitrificans]|uniref:SDR family NAD(P)-dependent oxidoreductase n=1 Tax=Brevibacillus nitrificans TaxID=651560 RepID=A0A3M8DKN7_9BACL|nr:SDR family NAD(P)-dependent oxidoreductase [Brevibacillus nitrificans]
MEMMTMKRAMVVGATGGTGAAITEELIRQGIETIAFGRSGQKLELLAKNLGNPAQQRFEHCRRKRPVYSLASN